MTTLDTKRGAKYLQLADEFRSRVGRGNLKPGDQLPSFVEMRRAHQVSRATVDKAHSLLEKEGLIVREQGRGVFVAQPRSTVRKGAIGFLCTGVSAPPPTHYWANLLAGLQQGVLELGGRLTLLDHRSLSEEIQDLQGVIFSESERSTRELADQLPVGFPCLSLMTPVDGISCVMADDFQGAKDATEHLIELGHRRIGYLVAGDGDWAQVRLSGYYSALRRHGIAPEAGWVRPFAMLNEEDSLSAQTQCGREAMEEWLASDWKQAGCTAVLTQNDQVAVGAIEALRVAGLGVPDDVSIIGFDGTEVYDLYRPRPTTVEIPLRAIGRRASELMSQLIAQRGRPIEKIALQTKLRIGDSTAAPKQTKRS